MERRISKEEVKRAVWDCGVDKSPGPDGFSFSFYRHFWPVIKKDVFEAVDYFFMYGEILNGCNSNFIALIPKILDANMVKDFRPISLIGSLYKIIAKILANRLVGVLGDLVNEVQSAFVADRQILDGPFILDEVLQWCRRKKKHAFIFKVDFEKAFDSVRWDFVDDVWEVFKNAASKLGCLVLKTLFTYLGTKVGGNMSRKQAWKEVVDKVLSRLLRWKDETPSNGGRLTLLKLHLIEAGEWGEHTVLGQKLNATVSFEIEFRQVLDNSFFEEKREKGWDFEEMQLNSLAEISRMTTLVPYEDSYVWTLESDDEKAPQVDDLA
ncbi:RNA-directed DNA polymerase, eukaryota, reverse transcriptase zinc-binding domain protein [Tanacetum coccineum]